MPLAKNPHAPFNISTLDPVGACDRCDFLYPLAQLAEQQQWAGPKLVSLGLRVCPRCLDEPNEQLRTIVIGPDPEPLKNPRPTRYKQQAGPNKTNFVLDDPNHDALDGTDILP